MPNIAKEKQESEKMERPPIVVVMGHIDHGKTTLLDFIRKTKVAEKESGGITQAIGAYEAEHKGKRITFIDTPGHEAFSKMRSRGANIADCAILVISAEEGVRPQTIEAIAAINESFLPFVIAINKIDRPNADAARTKKDLAENNVLIEEYGGKVPTVEISAKTGEGIDALLDTVLLIAELEELTWTPNRPAEGVVIEARVEGRKGRVATLLVRDGVLKKGAFAAIDNTVTPIRVLENFRGNPITEATASMPVIISNLTGEISPGNEFKAFSRKADAETYAAGRNADPPLSVPQTKEEARPMLNIIVKADVLGSKEAVEHLLEHLQFQNAGLRILKSETGDISESDIKRASGASHTLLLGFRVKAPPAIKELADIHGIPIITSEVIYEFEDAVKEKMAALVPSEMRRVDLGRVKILALFKKERRKQIIGGKVLEGQLKRDVQFDIERNKTVIGSGKVIGLQREKQNADEVPEGSSFGMLCDADLSIVEGDVLSVFEKEKITPPLQ